MTQAATKSRTKTACASLLAYTSAMARNCEFEPNTRSTTVPVHFGAPVARSRPSITPGAAGRRLPGRAHVDQVDEEVIAQRARALREHAVRRRPHVRAEHAQPADQHRHLGCRQRQQLRLVDQQLGRLAFDARAHPVAKAIGHRFQRGEGMPRRSALAEASVRPGAKGTVTACPPCFAAASMAAPPASTIRSASEIFLPPRCALLKACAMPSSTASTFARSAGWLTAQSFCGARRMRAPVGAAALVAAAEGRGRGPGGADQLRHRQPRGQHLLLQQSDVGIVDQRVIDRRHRVLPDQHLGRHQLAEVARTRAHVAVGQLEPGAGEGIGEGRRVVQKKRREIFS